jgi:hypothetical protein
MVRGKDCVAGYTILDSGVPARTRRSNSLRPHRCPYGAARISFSIAPAYRCRSLGTQLLRLTADLASQESGVRAVEGITFVENRASNHAFVRAGFEVIEEKSIAGHACFVFRRSCLPPHGGEPFDSGKAELRQQAVPVLEKVVTMVLSRPGLWLEVSGHTVAFRS